jgi:hypothetical protein
MKIHFTLPLGSEGSGTSIEMPGVPRVGESVHFGTDDDPGPEHRVRTVVWYPDDPDIDVYVVLQP